MAITQEPIDWRYIPFISAIVNGGHPHQNWRYIPLAKWYSPILGSRSIPIDLSVNALHQFPPVEPPHGTTGTAVSFARALSPSGIILAGLKR